MGARVGTYSAPVLRRLIVAVAVCELLAGCSRGPTLTATDRAICREFNQLPTVPTSRAGATPSKRSFQILHVFISPDYLHGQLNKSSDPVFTRDARELYVNVDQIEGQIPSRCKALGL
jgi:hypothetical protein